MNVTTEHVEVVGGTLAAVLGTIAGVRRYLRGRAAKKGAIAPPVFPLGAVAPAVAPPEPPSTWTEEALTALVTEMDKEAETACYDNDQWEAVLLQRFTALATLSNRPVPSTIKVRIRELGNS